MRLTRNQKMLSRSLAKTLTSITLIVLCAVAVTISFFSLELKTEARGRSALQRVAIGSSR